MITSLPESPRADAFARVQGWRGVRDSAEWRLTRHFFRAMFDFGVLTEAGADSLRHMMLGAIGGIVTFGLLLTRVLIGRYMLLGRYPTGEPYRQAMLGDDMLIIGLPMLFAAVMTLLVSDALFPDERDFRILGPLPIRRSTVFATKLAGLLLFAGLCIAVAHVAMLPWVLVSSVNRWLDHNVLLRLAAWLIASVGASYFAVFTVCAVVGLLVLTLSGGRRQSIGALMKSAVFAALVLCIPLVLQVPSVATLLAARSPWLAAVPPAWFLGLQRTLVGRADGTLLWLAAAAIAGLLVVGLITVGTYVLLFRHFERLVLKPVDAEAGAKSAGRRLFRSRGSPAFHAIAGFTLTTLVRSQLHQSAVVGLSMFGIGVAFNSLIGATPRSLARLPYWAPLLLVIVSGAAIRLSLSFPLQHRANWIFKMTEDAATRRAQFRAVDSIVAAWVAGPSAALAFALWWFATGRPSFVAAAIVGLLGLITVHWGLRDWRRIPFTCSYLPGKRFVAYSAMVGFFMCAFFMLAGIGLVRVARSNTRLGIVIILVLSLVAWLLRRSRLAVWSRTPLMFEDELPDQAVQLHL
jgi:hypothetical protein